MRASNHCMVASGHPLAVEAALQVLREGGSAIDAAVAADAVLGVVEPMATGIGGDLLAMVVEADGTAVSYNGTGRSPMDLTPDAVKHLPGQKIPERHALSVTTPGVVQGWSDLHRRYGKVPWRRLLEPAVSIARQGFGVAPVAAREWALFSTVLRQDPTCAALYRAGQPPQAGELFSNPQLAGTLDAVAHDGRDAFYAGPPAEAAAQANRSAGGVLSAADFARHRGEFTTPLSTMFRGLTVLECPPNTHGVAVLDALDELQSQELAFDNPNTTVAVVRAMAGAMAKAKATVADPAGNTVCTVVVDGQGLAVTLMTSVFKRFGSAIGVPGCGFVLQNRGSGFAEAGHVNGVAPSKRPYHTVIPAAVTQGGKFHAGLGVVGGTMQPQGQLQLLLRLAVWGTPLQEAIDAPRWRLESGASLAVEPGTAQAIVDSLRAAGYAEPRGTGELAGRSDFGGAQVVMRCSDGGLIGGSDRRKDGMARGF